jgi:hypothetical protein
MGEPVQSDIWLAALQSFGCDLSLAADAGA